LPKDRCARFCVTTHVPDYGERRPTA